MQLIATPTALMVAKTYLSNVDPILYTIIKKTGLPLIRPHKNYYQELVESIVSQQLSVKAASTILKRFVDLFPGDEFPTPDQILKVDIEQLRAVGLSRQKGGYIQDLAIKVLDRTITFNHLDRLSNDEVIAELVQIKGVGIWTIHMFLMFCMGRLNVLPIGDLGIKNGIQKLYSLDHSPTPEEITAIAHQNKWHPYESVASWYVWHSLNNKPSVS